MKKIFYFIGLMIALSSCGTHYSDEITLDDLLRANNQEVKTEKATPAPARKVTSEELPIQQSTPVQAIATTPATASQALPEDYESYVRETTPTQLPPAENYIDFSNVDITPEVYAIAARRATSKMLDSSSEFYFRKPLKPTIYIADIKKLNEQLPDGIYFARKVTYDMIEGSRNFVVVDNPEDAEYKLEIAINAIPTQYVGMPALDYQLHLYNRNGQELKQWNAVIKQVVNDDKSWW